MNDEHIMPDGYDAAKHVSAKECPCSPVLIDTDAVTGDEVWEHKNY